MNNNERKSRIIIALRGDFLIRCANYPEVLNLINHIPTTTYIVKSLGIEEDQENIRICRRLEVYCREWVETYRKSDDALLTGAWLAEVEEWEKRVEQKLTGDEREFLEKSLEKRDREVQDQIKVLEKEIKLNDEKLKAQKQRTRWAIASGILLTFTLGLGFWLKINYLNLPITKRSPSTSSASPYKIGILPPICDKMPTPNWLLNLKIP
jgi:hypothetical protein